RDDLVTGVQTCALPISGHRGRQLARLLAFIPPLIVVDCVPPERTRHMPAKAALDRSSTLRPFLPRLTTRWISEQPDVRVQSLPRSEERRVGEVCRCRVA